jgi:hypothetical protein
MRDKPIACRLLALFGHCLQKYLDGVARVLNQLIKSFALSSTTRKFRDVCPVSTLFSLEYIQVVCFHGTSQMPHKLIHGQPAHLDLLS